MTFLNPAVLIGLLAASIPVLIHLLNLRKLKKIEFSTLSFLKELQKNKIRKVKLKQWLLLALRILIITGIVFAFARPALRGTTIGGTASTAKTTAVFILDDTYSMSVIGSRGSYINHAKETIRHLINEMQEGDEAALILISGRDQEKISPTSNLPDLIKRINETEVVHAGGFIHNAIARSAEIISASQNFNKEIYIFSDFQSGRINAEKSLSDFSEVFNENVKLYGFNYSGKTVYNIAVTDFKLQTQIFEKNKPVSFDVTVTNFSEDDVSDIVLSLFMNGERSGQKSVDIPSGNSVTVNIESNLKQAGYNEFFCEIEDDEIIHDNRRYISINVPEEIPVALFYEDYNDVKFLELALQAAGENNPLKISLFNVSRIPSINLSNFNSIIIAGAGDIQGIEKLKAFTENGGGTAIYPSSESTPESFSTLLSSLSLPAVNGSTGRKVNDGVNNRFSKTDFDHPVFTDIFLKEKKNIESPDIYFNYKINPSGKGKSIINLADGTSFMSEYYSGKGKYIVFSSLPHFEWNNLPVKGIFPALTYKTILYLSYSQKEEENLLAGETVLVNLSGKTVPQVKITKPDGTSSTITTGGENYIEFKNTESAGVYNVSFEDKIIEKIDINTDPAESANKYASEDDFREYLDNIKFNGEFVNINPEGDYSGAILQARFGSELWKIFAVLTMLLALAEMTIARSMKKDISVIK